MINIEDHGSRTRQLATKAPAKRSQQANATYCNIVGRNMLRAFGHRVAICWVLLAQIWPFSNLSQQHPTCRNTVAKRTQHVTTNNVAICCVGMLWSFGRSLSFRTSTVILWYENNNKNLTSRSRTWCTVFTSNAATLIQLTHWNLNRVYHLLYKAGLIRTSVQLQRSQY